MDPRHFDLVAREIGAGTPRRRLPGWLVPLVLSSAFLVAGQPGHSGGGVAQAV